MCVIMIVNDNKNRPTDSMVENAWAKNDDGAGIAWRETVKVGDKKVTNVHWEKGLNLKEVSDYIKTVPTPYVVHFRIASVGGVRDTLTHPFQISTKTSLELSGKTKDYVLFHNGDWKGWDEAAREAAIRTGNKIPTGKWSDSRAMAWLCAIYGLGFMEFLPNQKGVAFGPDDMEVFTGGGWTKVNDIWCSNDYFYTSSVRNHGGHQASVRMCKFGDCTIKFNLDTLGYCPLHPNGKILASEVAKTESAPFHPKNSQGPFISLEIAEMMHKEDRKVVSKNLLKEVRRGWELLRSTELRKKAKGQKVLMEVSAKPQFAGLLG